MDIGPNKLTFDKATHRYTLDGVVLPSVTEIMDGIITDYSKVPADLMEQARIRGQVVHSVCELYDRETLDFSTVATGAWPYLQAWINFRHDCQFVPSFIEQSVYSEKYMYAGTLDRFGVGVFGGRITNAYIDIKTPKQIDDAPGVQLSAYAAAAKECGVPPVATKTSLFSAKRFAVYLGDNGKYRLERYDSQQDFPVFLAALQIFHYRKRTS